MDLNEVRGVAADYRGMDDELRELHDECAAQALEWLDSAFLPEVYADMDRAAIAWYIAELVGNLRQVHAGDLSRVLNSCTAGYGLTAARLLGVLGGPGDEAPVP